MSRLKGQLTGFPSPPPRPPMVTGLSRILLALGPKGANAVRDVSVCPPQRTIWLHGSASRMQGMLADDVFRTDTSGRQRLVSSPRRRTQCFIVAAGSGKLSGPHCDSRGHAWGHRTRWEDREREWRGKDWIGDFTAWMELEYALLRLMEVDNPAEGHEDRIDYDDWMVIPIPDPGGPQYHHYSISDKAWNPPTDFTPYRICDQPRLSMGRSDGPALLQLEGFGKKKFPPLFCSHGIDLTELHRIRHCGSLIWPSFAVTWQVPPSYGDIVFLADMSWVAKLLRPCGRPNPSVLFSPSDAWTFTVRSVERYAKAINYELKGDPEWWGGHIEHNEGGWGRPELQNTLINTGLSKDRIRQAFAPDIVEEGDIDTTKKLADRLEAILAIRRRLSPDPYYYPTREEILQTVEQVGYSTGLQYGYMELKPMCQVEIRSLPVCLYPRRNRTSVTRFLDRVGFSGWRIPFTWGGPTRDKMGRGIEEGDAVRRKWARTVTGTILQWAQDPCEYPVDATPRGVINEHYSVHQFRAGAVWDQRTKRLDGTQWRTCGPPGATKGHIYGEHGLNLDVGSMSSWGDDRHAAGILLTTGTKALLLKRSPRLDDGETWAAPGGTAKHVESQDLDGLLRAAWREFSEECGPIPDSVVPNDYRILGTHGISSPRSRLRPEVLVFTTFIVRAEDEFEPTPNWENTEARWFTRQQLTSPQWLEDNDIVLHPGTVDLLSKQLDTVFFGG